MIELRKKRDHTVFMTLKKELAMAVQSAHRAEEIAINSYKSLRAEESRRETAQKISDLHKKKLQEVTAKLAKVESAKAGLEADLKTTTKQAEDQCLMLRQAEDNLLVARRLVEDLKKDLHESEKAKEEAIKGKEEAIEEKKKAEKAKEEAENSRDQAEQDGYDIGVKEVTETFKAQVPEVCRHYCLQVWNEALSQAGVDASSTLWKAESVYYPPAIRASSIPDTAQEAAQGSSEDKGGDLAEDSTLPEDAPEQLDPAQEKAIEDVQPSSDLRESSKDELGDQANPITLIDDPKGKGIAVESSAQLPSPQDSKGPLKIKLKQ
ncbi:uncharacterized protein LOC142638230 [Castanea sativa]|uniref:uncharacterized protein LOC142638230 n=1 Tax=Castanea sativa TaxID=21020 RepID=UPI003F64AD2D